MVQSHARAIAEKPAGRAAIYSFTALRNNQREIKNRALEDVVHITENGNAAYVFCSEDVFEREKRNAVEDAVRNIELSQLIRQGRADIANGRCVEGLDAAKARMHEAWHRNG